LNRPSLGSFLLLLPLKNIFLSFCISKQDFYRPLQSHFSSLPLYLLSNPPATTTTTLTTTTTTTTAEEREKIKIQKETDKRKLN